MSGARWRYWDVWRPRSRVGFGLVTADRRRVLSLRWWIVAWNTR